METLLGILVISFIVAGWTALFLRGTRWDVVDALHRRRGPDTPPDDPVRVPAADRSGSRAPVSAEVPDGPARHELLPSHPQLAHTPHAFW